MKNITITVQVPEDTAKRVELLRAPMEYFFIKALEEALLPSNMAAVEAVVGALEAESLGFRGGWVSSTHLDALIGGDVPPNKRRDLMASLGYAWHPALVDGRVNNPLACDYSKKSRLYVSGWPLLDIVRPADVARAYEEAQR